MIKKLLLLNIFFIPFIVLCQVGIQSTITDNLSSIKKTISADLDNDGDLDIVSISTNDKTIAWFENLDGLGNFGPKNIIFQDNLNFPVRTALAIKDMNNDGYLDIVTAVPSEVIVYHKIIVYENTLITAPPNPSGWFSFDISTDVGASFIYIADIDNDGIDDIISDGLHANYNETRLIWLKKNDSNFSYSIMDVIDDTANTLSDISIEDIDNDGDLDIAASYNTKIIWFENLNGLGTSWQENIVFNTPVGSDLIAGETIKLVDLDSDGDNDILLTSNEYNNKRLIWYENLDGLGNFGQENIITNNVVCSFFCVDFDFDGDLDLLLSQQNSTLLLNNIDGLGNFSTGQLINDNCVGSIYTTDINNDNVLDIVFNSFDSILWIDILGDLSNEINGSIKFDLNSNGCDASDISTQNIPIISYNNLSNFMTFSDLNGNYIFNVTDGNFTTQITLNSPNYYVSNPIFQSSSFVGGGNTDTVDFCIEPIGTINDLNVSVYPSIDDPRPGFDTTYQIVYNNVGTTQLSGNVTFQFDDAKLNFLSASETVASQTANTITFDYSNLNPFETRTIDLEFNVFPPPTTNIDDVLNTTVTVNPVTGDNTLDDNVFELAQTVIGSYDPNDIRVLEGEEILLADADKYLHYIIRFQNTGTASAINVRVNNVLDSKLDWTTMQLESLSHDGRVEITNGSNVDFIFDNINLADSTSDEPNSHGFITYKIKPKDNVVIGDTFLNTADIFFDFNPPITTNTASTTIVNALSVTEFEISGLSIYPNPANNVLNIDSKVSMQNIVIYDVNGRRLQSLNVNDTSSKIDITDLSVGLYFIEINSENKKQVKKFIKK